MLLIGPWAWAPSAAQLSPGPLSRAHKKMDNTGGCLQCHARGENSLAANCLSCHTGIAGLIKERRGYHGLEAGADCSSCHPEHAGRDFDLIEWKQGSARKFDHRLAGWILRGKHADKDCKSCHNDSLQERSNRLPAKAAPANWIGLGTDCITCHEDTHKGRLGEDCAACHVESSWKEVPKDKMDHALTRYPLLGGHQEVECAACHDPEKAGGERPVYFTCNSCHRDPHAGKATLSGQQVDCASCHTVDRFKPSTFTVARHAASAYPLKEKHAPVACASCHTSTEEDGVRIRLAHEDCADCHKDPHKGKATLAGKAVDCAACHTTAGFAATTFSVAQHAKSSYPLEGKHRTVECAKCHPKSESGVRIRIEHATCRDCHKDAHPGQLAGRADGGACESCHNVEGWVPSLFGLPEHTKLELPLAGEHSELKCGVCHRPLPGKTQWLPPLESLGAGRVALSDLPTGCKSCHQDPHLGRFEATGESPRPGACRACHGQGLFRPALVDAALHREFTYPLEGAHQAVPCSECHEDLMVKTEEKKDLLFKASHQRCDACHRTPHGDQFEKMEKLANDDCAGCHGLDQFILAERFDHETMASFSLTGAHRTVPCGDCHKAVIDAAGSGKVIYSQAPPRCQDCHARGSRALATASSEQGGSS